MRSLIYCTHIESSVIELEGSAIQLQSSPIWNAKLTETQIFSELSIEIFIELKSSLIQLKRSLIQLGSPLIQL